MQRIRFLLAVTGLVGAVLSTTPGLAASSATASITGLTWALTDLDPNDGIVPEIAFASQIGMLTSAAANVWIDGSPLVSSYQPGVANPTAFVSIPGTQLMATADVMLGELSPASLSLSLHTTGSASAGPLGGLGLYSTFSDLAAWKFSLSRATRVEFSTLASVSVTLDGGGDSLGEANARFRFTDPGSFNILEISTAISDIRAESVLAVGRSSMQALSASETRVLSIALSNVSDGDIEIGLRFNAYTSGWSVASPVPEPGTWSMLLGGVGLVVATARRRAVRG